MLWNLSNGVWVMDACIHIVSPVFDCQFYRKIIILVTAVFQNSNQHSLHLPSLPSGRVRIMHSWTNHLGPKMQRTMLLSPCESCIENEKSNVIHSMPLEIMSGYNQLNIEEKCEYKRWKCEMHLK